MNPLFNLCRTYDAVSIVGLEKNVGKTTTLNWLIEGAPQDFTLGLTSIGIDGEAIDQVTATVKPRIFVSKGTIVATAIESYYRSDCTKELLVMTGINTSIGEVVIFKCLSAGFVELAGPSIGSQIKKVVKVMRNLGARLVLVDSALSRVSIASPTITCATVLATGAAVHPSSERVITLTQTMLQYFSLPKGQVDTRVIKKELQQSKVIFIEKDGSMTTSNVQTSLGQHELILMAIEKGIKTIIIGGALINQLAEKLINKVKPKSKINICIENGTKCLISRDNYEKLKKIGIELQVLDEIKVIAVTYNPVSPQGIGQSLYEFKHAMGNTVNIPIYDVMEEMM